MEDDTQLKKFKEGSGVSGENISQAEEQSEIENKLNASQKRVKELEKMLADMKSSQESKNSMNDNEDVPMPEYQQPDNVQHEGDEGIKNDSMNDVHSFLNPHFANLPDSFPGIINLNKQANFVEKDCTLHCWEDGVKVIVARGRVLADGAICNEMVHFKTVKNDQYKGLIFKGHVFLQLGAFFLRFVAHLLNHPKFAFSFLSSFLVSSTFVAMGGVGPRPPPAPP
ncbi:hypothetical protein ACFE04_028788 [Oxalis oulophora]